jgi:hypothetical protein
MPPFRRVEARQAGPLALGILIPPGQRTFIILRPRALPWDLLPLPPTYTAGTGPNFVNFGRDEAALRARRIAAALEQPMQDNAGPVEVDINPWGEGHLLRLLRDELYWIVCPRRPGQPYQPLVFSAADEAAEAARQLARFVCPAADAGQEYYFNTQHFGQ